MSGIGQPLSMLLKLNPAVTKLALYDIVHTPGVAADLSHVETKVMRILGFFFYNRTVKQGKIGQRG